MQHSLVELRLELRAAVERIARQHEDVQLPREAPAVRAVYQHLMEQEIDVSLGLALASQLSEEISIGSAAEPAYVRRRLLELLRDRLPVASLLLREDGPQVVVLVGPTGVGKTTTLAKLAAHLALYQGRKVGLVTTDTFRIAAVGQLGTYADIMGLPLDVVYTADELADAVAKHAGLDVILVDTPGCSQRNEAQLRELAGMLAAVPNALVLLALAAPTKARDLVEIHQSFGVLPVQGLVLTKLDETSIYGPIVSLVHRASQPVYYVAAGQHVPSDIEPVTGHRLAELLAGSLFSRQPSAVSRQPSAVSGRPSAVGGQPSAASGQEARAGDELPLPVGEGRGEGSASPPLPLWERGSGGEGKQAP